jgi:hypothetical protein
MTTTAQTPSGIETEALQMVEAFIREHTGEYDRDGLVEALSRRIPAGQFSAILDALIASVHVGIDAAGMVCYIYNPALAQRLKSRPDFRIR